MRDGAPVKTQSTRKNVDGLLGGRQLVGGPSDFLRRDVVSGMHFQVYKR